MITTTARSARWWVSLVVAGTVALAACGDDAADDTVDADADANEVEDADTEEVDGEVGRGEDVPAPALSGPVTGGDRGLPFNPLPARLAEEYGYIEEEFFVAGDATAYEPVGDWSEYGEWEASPTDTTPYRTRILVRRPADAEAFNGTVVVEWLNVTTGVDFDYGFMAAHEELLRGGYVWVGVSAQQVGVEGAGASLPGLDVSALKEWDPERYGDLDHPGDDYSYDIYSQVAQAIRRPEGADPLDGLTAQHVIATGESQSAFRMITYVNAVHPIADIYDGFMIHSRWASAIPLSEETAPAMPGLARIRTDLSDPVMQFQTEADVFDYGFHPARQPDAERIRTWEVAGTAHLDKHMLDYMGKSIEEWDDSDPPDLSECGINEGPQAVVVHAAWAALTEWVGGGEPPARAEPLDVNDGVLARDQHGNALGGVRTPAVEAPISTLTGEGACPFFGSMEPFDQATLGSLYPTHRDYVEAVRASTQSAVDAGFLVPEDGDAIIDEAERAPIPE